MCYLARKVKSLKFLDKAARTKKPSIIGKEMTQLSETWTLYWDNR